MAFLKKFIDKATYMLIVGTWNLCSVYLLNLSALSDGVKTLIIGIGNLVIVWLGIESGQAKPDNGNNVKTEKVNNGKATDPSA